MKLNDLIMQLQNLEAEHGNIEVLHSDCEWGVDIAKLQLAKVVDVGYKLEISAEEAARMREEVAKGFDEAAVLAEIMEWWDAHADQRIFTDGPQGIVNSARGSFDEKVKMLALYDAAEYTAVIGQ